jgi:hypothetical protein
VLIHATAARWRVVTSTYTSTRVRGLALWRPQARTRVLAAVQVGQRRPEAVCGFANAADDQMPAVNELRAS